MRSRAAWLRYTILAVQREGNRLLTDKLRPVGVTPAQAEVLTVVDEWGPLHLRRLGSLLVCEAGSPSRLVAALVAKGLLERAADPADRRRLAIGLTAAGRLVVDAIHHTEQELYVLMAQQIPRSADWAEISGALLAGTSAEKVLRRRGILPMPSPPPMRDAGEGATSETPQPRQPSHQGTAQT